MFKLRQGAKSVHFEDLKGLMAWASSAKAADQLAGIAAPDDESRALSRLCLAEVPLGCFLEQPAIPYERDEVTRLILDRHDAAAFAPVAHLSVGELREYLLSYAVGPEELRALAPGLTPEMVAAVSKLMRNHELVRVAKKCSVVTRFRSTLGLPGTLCSRLQPNHPLDDPRGIMASILDGLLFGIGDAVIGVNPAKDSVDDLAHLCRLLDELRQRLEIPTQTCVLGHITTTLRALERGAPVDLVFQSIAGTENANQAFGIDLALLRAGQQAALATGRNPHGHVMYFETGQGSALSSNAAFGVDAQTLEARAYAVAREFSPLLVNTVVGFIGPEYLFDAKQITRAALEDHFCGKLLGVPMGVDVCYTNHAEADQNDMDNIMLLLALAGVNFLIAVPGADDVMLGYQSLSYHDVLTARHLTAQTTAPEFAEWLTRVGLEERAGQLHWGDTQRLLSAFAERGGP
jgi:ethanolamine ammonia-lyase large subunit